MMKMNKIGLLLILGVLWASCQEYIPKPYAYPKVLYPEKEYIRTSADCPYSFEIPKYSKLEAYEYEEQPCWYNLQFPDFKATLHLSYLPVSSQFTLDSLTEDAYQMVFKPHLQKADEIIQREISDTVKGLHGMVYDLEGKTATPYNFYITDKKNHFLRGSFYFNAKTSRDSIAPIYKFLNQDLLHVINTMEFQ